MLTGPQMSAKENQQQSSTAPYWTKGRIQSEQLQSIALKYSLTDYSVTKI